MAKWSFSALVSNVNMLYRRFRFSICGQCFFPSIVVELILNPLFRTVIYARTLFSELPILCIYRYLRLTNTYIWAWGYISTSYVSVSVQNYGFCAAKSQLFLLVLSKDRTTVTSNHVVFATAVATLTVAHQVSNRLCTEYAPIIQYK